MPSTNGHGSGSTPYGTPLEEPIDLVAVQADDELINALAAGFAVPTTDAAYGGDYRADDQVVALLSAWRVDVAEEPIPELIDLETAVAAVQAGIKAARPRRPRPSGRTRHLVPVAAAAALLVLSVGSLSIGSANAEPDSVLWPVSEVLFSERAVSVEAAVRVSDKIDSAKLALNEGKPEVAKQDLAQAQRDIQSVRPQEGRAQLVDVKEFLVAKAAETPLGTKVDPGSPLKTDKSRPIPAGAALTEAPTAEGTVTPEPTSAAETPTSPVTPTHPSKRHPTPSGSGSASVSTTSAPQVAVPTDSSGSTPSTTATATTPEDSADTSSATTTTTSTTSMGSAEHTSPTAPTS